MAITDDYAPIKTLGNGATTAFSTNNWSPLVAEYLLVYLESVATGVQTLQVLGVDCTFAFTGTGFTVTFTVAPTSANYVVIGREVALDQSQPYKTSRGWQGDVIEGSFDKLTAMAQDSKDSEQRSLKYQLASGKSGTIGLPVDGAVLVFSGPDGDITDGPTVAQISSAEQNAIDAAAAAAAAAASAATISDFDLSGTPAANDAILWDTGVSKFVRKTLAQLKSALGIPSGTLSTISQLSKIQDFRLSLTTALPVTTADVTGATTIRAVPYVGNQIALYDGTNWNVQATAEFSLALGTLLSGRPYDVFCYDNAGVPTLEFTAWTNDTTRATALVYQDGVLSRSGALTRRYLGTFYTTSTTTTEDSVANRYLSNYYHRIMRPIVRKESTTSWTYSTAAFRQANASTSNQLNFLVGVAENMVSATAISSWSTGDATNRICYTGIGLDSTTVNSADVTEGTSSYNATSTFTPSKAHFNQIVAVGKHSLTWLEYGAGASTQTWRGISAPLQSGIIGSIMA